MTDFAWVIEAPGQNYLGTREIGHHPEFYWTPDHAKAVRFISAEQADGVMMAVRRMEPKLWAFAVNLGEAKPVEHGWIDQAGSGVETEAEALAAKDREIEDLRAELKGAEEQISQMEAEQDGYEADLRAERAANTALSSQLEALKEGAEPFAVDPMSGQGEWEVICRDGIRREVRDHDFRRLRSAYDATNPEATGQTTGGES